MHNANQSSGTTVYQNQNNIRVSQNMLNLGVNKINVKKSIFSKLRKV